MNIIKIGETNVTLTDESYARYMNYKKDEEKLEEASDAFHKALRSYLYDEDGCDKSDLYDYEAAENDTCIGLWEAWELFAQRGFVA